MREKMICKMTALLLIVAMCVGLCTGFTVNAGAVGNSASDLRAPGIEEDPGMEAKQKVTWDCVWFGNYPQSEVESSAPIYNTLQGEDGWDDNNDITIGGNRYRRMKKGDATYAVTGDSDHYNWSDEDTYHYFKYEPVKWRVLKTDGNQALLLSDVALDDQRYNTVEEDVTWKTSTIRSWLNGYGSSDNQQGTDYSGRNFIGSAFTSDEWSAIADTSVVNAGNLSSGTEGGNDTVDKIFLLSESEVYGEGAVPYGFVSESDTYDEARRSKSSTYAKAMGVWSATDDTYKDDCHWWLRSPAYYLKSAAGVLNTGNVGGIHVDYNYVGVRPALNLNLSSNQWTYAGTVCSDGTTSSGNGNEDEAAVTGIELLSEEKLNLTVGDTSLVKCKVIPSNAANPAISWTSGDEKIATVNEEGLITCVGAGTTLITAKTADGGFTKEVEVIVREKPSADKEDPSDPSVSKPAPPKTATLSSTSYTYNGKVRRPSVTVKDSNGKTIGAGNYTVTYPAGRKNVGRYTVKITFKGSYTGSMKKSFEIKPRGTSICRIKAGKKSFTVKWKKQAKQTTGYQIQYSTNKKFKCGKKRTVLVNKSKTPRRKITKLKAKKKYYVRIRTYKTVKIKGKSQKIYSGWSKSKKVVVKK